MLHGLKACPINKSQLKFLNFVLNNVFGKLFTMMLLMNVLRFPLHSLQRHL